MRVIEVIIDVSVASSPEFSQLSLLTSLIGLQVVCRANSDIGMVRFDPTVGAFINIDEFRDESFNSITGLNGSGKSNILDSICFVLGITNMSTVRAQNLQVRLYILFAA